MGVAPCRARLLPQPQPLVVTASWGKGRATPQQGRAAKAGTAGKASCPLVCLGLRGMHGGGSLGDVDCQLSGWTGSNC